MKKCECTNGKVIGIFPISIEDNSNKIILMKCQICDGKEFIDTDTIIRILEGKRIRKNRLKQKLTLRKYCKINGIDVIKQSNIERGIKVE